MIDTILQRRCLRDQIRDCLLERILNGVYAPGYRLIELDLAQEFEVSQSPVREALRELEAMGMVESQRYRGTRVRASDAAEMREAYTMRALIEQYCAEQVVPCEEDFMAALDEDLAGLHACARSRDVIGYSRHAFAFHQRIVAQGGSRLFLQVWHNLQTRAPLPFVANHLADRLPHYAQAHDPVLDHLRCGDGKAAGLLLRAFMLDLCHQLPD